MRTAIASMGKDEDAQMCEIAGRAPFYLIFDGKKLIKAIKNPFQFGGGAGLSVAKMLENEKVNLIIAGHIGPHMKNSLKSAGIEIKIVELGKKIKELL